MRSVSSLIRFVASHLGPTTRLRDDRRSSVRLLHRRVLTHIPHALYKAIANQGLDMKRTTTEIGMLFPNRCVPIPPRCVPRHHAGTTRRRLSVLNWIEGVTFDTVSFAPGSIPISNLCFPGVRRAVAVLR
jgi:hypothetical protein